MTMADEWAAQDVPFGNDNLPWYATVEAQESVVDHTWGLCYNPIIGSVPSILQRENVITFTVLPSGGGYRVYQHLGSPTPDNQMAVMNQFIDNPINLQIIDRLSQAMTFTTFLLNQQGVSYPDAFGARIEAAHKNGVWTLVWADTGRQFDVNRVWRPVGDHLNEARRVAEALRVLYKDMSERIRLVNAS